MWASSVNQDRLQRFNSRNPDSQWHRPDLYETYSAATPHPTEEVESGFFEDRSTSGTWGERDVGGFDPRGAAVEAEALRRNLQLGRTRSRDSQSSSLKRTTTLQSVRSRKSVARAESRSGEGARQPSAEREESQDVEADAGREQEDKDENKKEDEESEDLDLDQFMREGHFEKRTDGESAKKVGVIYRNLTVKGVGATAMFVRTLPDAILGTFGPDLYRNLCKLFPFLARHSGGTRTLIHDFSGCVRDGEMMLVLGRPGSGCSTFLKAVSNNREAYAEVTGDVSYGGIPANKQKKMYRGEVNYNPEDDVHFASLNVWQTFIFALANKTKKKGKDEIPIIADALLKMFGISHTKYTLVGDEYTRGVSGGERKRVSIAETLASKASVLSWDNSTRGLDASTALDYARSLRIMTDISNRTTLVTLYQAGEGIYELMDKVLVIHEGREIFTGPAKNAAQYFIDLGYEKPDRQTTADFLTAVTDPVERRFREGCEASTPKTAEELEKAFRASSNYQTVLEDISDYEKYLKESEYKDAKQFEDAVQEGKSKRVPKKSSYTVSFPRQVLACTKREFWLLLGDTTTLWTKLFIIISNGLIVGSLFYGEPLSTLGAFSRGGALFFSILFLGWLQLTELMKAVGGRAVVARHRDYAFYRPSAVSIARVVTDIPLILIQSIIFGVIMYFMCELDVEAGKFFIYLLFIYVTTLAVTALYRMFASLSPEIDTAVRFSGIALNLLVIYTGYVIPKTQLLSQYIWFGWLYWTSPISYAFEAVLSNEFAGRTMQCAPEQLVPRGPGADPNFQGCALPGAQVNSDVVVGSSYLSTQYNYTRAHLWRNFGVVIAFTILYIIVTALAVEFVSFGGAAGGALIFKRSKRAKQQVKEEDSPASDEEKAVGSSGDSGNSSTNKDNGLGDSPNTNEEEDQALEKITKSDSIFTWRDVNYTVPYLGGERQLLHSVNGYAKPGKMVALVGASGAGEYIYIHVRNLHMLTSLEVKLHS